MTLLRTIALDHGVDNLRFTNSFIGIYAPQAAWEPRAAKVATNARIKGGLRAAFEMCKWWGQRELLMDTNKKWPRAASGKASWLRATCRS